MTNYTLNFDPDKLDWAKVNDQIPVIVQNYRSGVVLMQGFMNREALSKTLEIGKVTFYSRTKKRLWTKGEESRHYLNLKAITADCDNDCLLIAADPIGPTCHRGTESLLRCLNRRRVMYLLTNSGLFLKPMPGMQIRKMPQLF